MNTSYNHKDGAANYIQFLDSVNGTIQKEVLSHSIIKSLSEDLTITILDAASGPGWLTNDLQKFYQNIRGFDKSPKLISYAKQNYPGILFDTLNILEPLPYQKESFNVVILNMAAIDISNLHTAFTNIFSMLKKNGQFIMTVPNPYYTYPIAAWKRSILDFVLGNKPKLTLINNYKHKKNIERDFGNGIKLASHFYSVEDYISAAKDSGFTLEYIHEIISKEDSKNFDLRYQLYRYPLFLLFSFKK